VHKGRTGYSDRKVKHDGINSLQLNPGLHIFENGIKTMKKFTWEISANLLGKYIINKNIINKIG